MTENSESRGGDQGQMQDANCQVRKYHLTQSIQVRDSDASENTMFYHVKCKHALVLFVVLVLLHCLLLAALSTDTGPQAALARTTRDIELSEEEEHAMASCSSGHVGGFPQVCDSRGCLRALGRPQQGLSLHELERHNVSHEVGSGSHALGWLAPVHVSLLAILTFIQWQHDVYGTVAGLGANQPIITYALASQLDVRAGEQLMLSDFFPHSGGHLEQLYSFLDRMESVEHDHSRHLRVHVGSPGEMNKRMLRDWNLPQFRLVSVDGSGDILSRLEQAMCVLHEGGIVILDGLDTHEDETYSTLTQFFSKYGSDVLSPLLWTRDKLYLCTSKWRRRYMQQLAEQHRTFLVTFHATEVTGSALYGGPQHSYYVVSAR